MMPVRRSFIVFCALASGCAAADTSSTSVAPPPATAATSTVVTSTTTTAAPGSTTTTTVPRPLVYVFPFAGVKVSYSRRHHDYPATDVFGCGATVVAPIGGTIAQTRRVDIWDPSVDDPATRGGKYVSMLGDDGVRYYFAHLDSVDVRPGDVVRGGTALGVVGQTGNARQSACHTHFGISRPCEQREWAVRRGEIWPWKYLDSWLRGEQLSPVAEVADAEQANPHACALAGLAPGASEA